MKLLVVIVVGVEDFKRARSGCAVYYLSAGES